ncbi:MAG TPA: IS256 family transposase [Segetibacter sp.]|jgi:transposase-like protein
MKEEKLDFEAFKQEALRKLRNKEAGASAEKLFKPLFKQFIEEALQAEIDGHLDDEERTSGNRRNGKSTKTVKSTGGEFELDTPRDRLGSFEPQLVGKRQIIISEEIEDKVLRMYSRGLSVRDITEHIEEVYGFTLSPTTLSRITDKVIPLIQEWQQRPLEGQYCIVWMDAMFYKVREEGRVVSKALYNILGLNTGGVKELLGIYLAESEGAKFWMQVLEDLKRRGVEDILIACIDNLKGFAEAIEVTFPKTEVQLCVIHQIRNSIKYVSWKDSKAFMKDLQTVYRASSKEQAAANLEVVAGTWGRKYPIAVQGWQNNWERLIPYFDYPDAIRKIMYTTNIIEGFHRQVRKVTKTKGAFTSDSALLKLIYLATTRMVEKWSQSIQGWAIIASQLKLIYGDRLQIQMNSITR